MIERIKDWWYWFCVKWYEQSRINRMERSIRDGIKAKQKITKDLRKLKEIQQKKNSWLNH